MEGISPSAAKLATKLIGKIGEVQVLSQTNNQVFKTITKRGAFILKVVSDPTVDVLLERDLLLRLGRNDLFRSMLQVSPLSDAPGFLVVAPFYEGKSLDAVLELGDVTQAEAERWARTMHEMFAVIATVPVTFFGRPRVNTPPTFSRWTAFLQWYLLRQKKKAPHLASMRYERLASAFRRIAPILDDATQRPTLVPADVNLRNFLVRSSERQLVMIHLPILWHGDTAVPYGESAIHLDRTIIGKELLELGAFSSSRIDWYAAFSAYVVLAFAERFHPSPLAEVRAWGGHRPLLEILDERLARLECEPVE